MANSTISQVRFALVYCLRLIPSAPSDDTFGKLVQMIRPYVASDWREICRVYDASKPLELGSAGVAASFVPLIDDQQRIDAFAASTVRVWEEGQFLLGFVGYRRDYIGWLFVHPGAHQRGIGRALLSSVVEEIDGEPYLWTMKGNESAIRLYASAGFQIVEHRKTQNRGMPCHAVKMKKTKAYLGKL